MPWEEPDLLAADMTTFSRHYTDPDRTLRGRTPAPQPTGTSTHRRDCANTVPMAMASARVACRSSTMLPILP